MEPQSLQVYNDLLLAPDRAIKAWVKAEKMVNGLSISDFHLLLLHTYCHVASVKHDYRVLHPHFTGNIYTFAIDEVRRRRQQQDYANSPIHDNQVLYFALAATVADANFVTNGIPVPDAKADYNFAIWNAINRTHSAWRGLFGFDLVGKMPKKPGIFTWWREIDWL